VNLLDDTQPSASQTHPPGTIADDQIAVSPLLRMVSRVGIEPTTRRLRGFGKAYTSVDVAVQDFWFVDSDGLNCAL
jgi:hypothetical protein